MYNVGRLSVFGQLTTCRKQTKKKPLVTEILPDPGYAWGWRCKLDYDRFFTIGQISLSYHRHQSLSGEWRWLNHKPSTEPEYNPIIGYFLVHRPGSRRSWLSHLCSTRGYSRHLAGLTENKRKPGIGSTWLSIIPLFNCILLWTLDVGSVFGAKPLIWGGGTVPRCSFVLRKHSISWNICQKLGGLENV